MDEIGLILLLKEGERSSNMLPSIVAAIGWTASSSSEFVQRVFK